MANEANYYYYGQITKPDTRKTTVTHTHIIIINVIIFLLYSTSDLQPSTAVSNHSPGKSFLNKFKLSLINSQYMVMSIYIAI